MFCNVNLRLAHVYTHPQIMCLYPPPLFQIPINNPDTLWVTQLFTMYANEDELIMKHVLQFVAVCVSSVLHSAVWSVNISHPINNQDRFCVQWQDQVFYRCHNSSTCPVTHNNKRLLLTIAKNNYWWKNWFTIFIEKNWIKIFVTSGPLMFSYSIKMTFNSFIHSFV